jgi:type VI secretion system protein VasG
MRVEPKALVRCLTPSATRMLESAVGKAVSAQHYEIEPEHMLLSILEADDSEAAKIVAAFDIDRARLVGKLTRNLDKMRSGNTRRPVFSSSLFQWFEDAWLVGSIERREIKLRSGVVLLTLLLRSDRYGIDSHAELEIIDTDRLKRDFDEIVGASQEASEAIPSWDKDDKKPSASATALSKDSALARFTANLTESARAGKIDPVFGRHREIRQMVDILTRRRKNNPIIVGEPGVGKTALVEGLALAIAQGDVPEQIKDVDLLSLDLGLLQAGASVKGEFENRLKAVISEVKASAKPIILFIDEAHTIIGAGGPRGGSDAANLLKPALARGELRTVAATTWAEYKKYFEKDAALERRFQPVKVDEPSEEDATVMLRGIRPIYEKAHQVTIRDEAVIAAVQLSHRYLSGRHLPDKAVDLLDTAAARVRVERAARPEKLVALDLEATGLEAAKAVIERDIADGDQKRRGDLQEVEEKLQAVRPQREAIDQAWKAEQQALQELLAAREALRAAKEPPAQTSGEGGQAAAPGGQAPLPAGPSLDELTKAVERASQKFIALGESDRLVHVDVDADSVARTVASWTGIPVGKMKRDTASSILGLEDKLRERIIGQEFAIRSVAETLRIAHAGIGNPDSPIGTMLFVGPSGVGKTETALALADQLYGGERFITTINKSEFQEKHTVSRLIGSPPGYVGYGEGGVLTEAVRQRPYSVVLLDECEKADLEVMNLFYQVFDKGMLSDGEGRPINFKNTLIILTSNLASDLIVRAFDNAATPEPQAVIDAIRPTLSRHFQPALLARMTIVPYGPIVPEAMRAIAGLKLKKISDRVEKSYGFRAIFSDELVEELVRRCTENETGARNIDHVLRGSLMPAISAVLLERLAEDSSFRELNVSLAPSGEWKIDMQ